MLFHQLPSAFDIPLFEGFRVADELLRHLLVLDDHPHAPVSRDILPQGGVRRADGVDLAAFRTAEEGELDIALHVGFRGDGRGYSAALVALDFHWLLLQLLSVFISVNLLIES